MPTGLRTEGLKELGVLTTARLQLVTWRAVWRLREGPGDPASGRGGAQSLRHRRPPRPGPSGAPGQSGGLCRAWGRGWGRGDAGGRAGGCVAGGPGGGPCGRGPCGGRQRARRAAAERGQGRRRGMPWAPTLQPTGGADGGRAWRACGPSPRSPRATPLARAASGPRRPGAWFLT